jgi:hypothetical protein
VVEHRDTARMVTSEGRPRDARPEPEAIGPRFARFVTIPTERRLVLSRLGLAVLSSVLALIVLGVIGTHVIGILVSWLHDQPQYQTTFDAIELTPPPPAWYRGGSSMFLDRVRQAAQRADEPFSALDLRLAELDREFRLYCWVKRVLRVERRWPNRLTVRLEYRRPVARANIPGEAVRVLLDEEGVILPIEDVDVEVKVDVKEEMSLPLLRIPGLKAPHEPRLGRVWRTDDGGEGLGKDDERVVAVVKLAAFLDAALQREPRPIPLALRPVALFWQTNHGIFIQNAENTMIYWSEFPGSERPGHKTAEQKWADLHAWLERRPPDPVTYPYYLDFTKDGVVIKKEGVVIK